MDPKCFGWTGVAVPPIGQGTWRMGESRAARTREVAALEAGLDLGLTHIDTAEMYGSGGAERVVAAAIAGRRRDDLFLVSKVLPENATRRGTVRACERSLERLRTDHLDLYLLHWPSSHPIGETMAAMEDLVRDGKVRFVGVSNFDVPELTEAMAALTRVRLACNQVLYNLGARGIERKLVPLCREHGIAVVGYTPLAKGGFPARASSGFHTLAEIADRHGATPRQVVLRFLTRSPELFTIPKAVDLRHVRENAEAASFELGPEEIAAIDRAFPAPRRRVPLATA
jgi:diketogulonate reductase-like aldo/keto reductase